MAINQMKAALARSVAKGRAGIPSGRQLSGMSWAMVGLLAPTLLQLVFMICAARLLGATAAGNFFLIVSVAMIASSFVGLGGGGLTMRDTARDHDAAGTALGRALAWSLVSFPFLLIGVVVAARYVTRGAVSIPTIALVASADMLALRCLTTFWSMFIAREEQVRGSLLICTMPLARFSAILAVLFVAYEDRLNTFCYAYVMASFVVLGIAVAYVQSQVGRIKLSLGGFDMRSGVSFALTWLNQALQTESDKLILSLFGSPAMVAVYAVASRLMDGAFMPPRALKNSLQGRLFREGAGGTSGAFRLTMKILPLTVAYGLIAWAGFALSAPLVVMLFGNEYRALADVLPMLGALPLLRTIADFGAEIFLASDRPIVQAMNQTFGTTFRVLLGFGLIGAFGLSGAVMTALSVNLISGAILWTLAWRAVRREQPVVQ